VSSARQSLGSAYLAEARGALSRNDLRAADSWLAEAHSIGFNTEEVGALEKQAADARTRVAQVPADAVVITNSSPRKVFDNAAASAVAQWRYKPVMREGKAVEQRAAVRIRFAEE
jgi:hypothetical protein